MSLPSFDSVNYTFTLLGIAAIGVGVWRSKTRKRFFAAIDAFVGREEVTDRSGNVITPAQPGAIHRLETMEAAVTTLAEVVTDQRELRGQVTNLHQRVGVLEDARAERLVTQVESAHMWRAVADNAATDADGD